MTESVFQRLLKIVISCNCEDVRLIAGAPPIVRVQDRLIRLEAACVTPQDLSNIAQAILPAASRDELATQGDIRFNYSMEDGVQFEIIIEANGNLIASPIKGRS